MWCHTSIAFHVICLFSSKAEQSEKYFLISNELISRYSADASHRVVDGSTIDIRFMAWNSNSPRLTNSIFCQKRTVGLVFLGACANFLSCPIWICDWRHTLIRILKSRSNLHCGFVLGHKSIGFFSGRYVPTKSEEVASSYPPILWPRS